VTTLSPVAGRALTVRTYGGQITIDLGPHGWHEHLGAWSGPTEAAAFDAALTLIADVLAERVVVAVGMRGTRPRWLRLVREGATPPRPWRIPWISADRVEIYSWRGSRDTTLDPSTRCRSRTP
jgi:hypothetical protein